MGADDGILFYDRHIEADLSGVQYCLLPEENTWYSLADLWRKPATATEPETSTGSTSKIKEQPEATTELKTSTESTSKEGEESEPATASSSKDGEHPPQSDGARTTIGNPSAMTKGEVDFDAFLRKHDLDCETLKARSYMVQLPNRQFRYLEAAKDWKDVMYSLEMQIQWEPICQGPTGSVKMWIGAAEGFGDWSLPSGDGVLMRPQYH